MPKPIAIEAVIIGSVHLCRSEKSERKRNAGIAQVIYLATLIGQSNPVFIIMYTAKNALYILLFRLIPYKSVEITKIIDNQSARSSGKISRPDELFRLFRKLLAEHYRHEHTIAFYADRLHVSRPYLSRIIRQVSGKTVNTFIMEALLTEAKRLLVFTDLAIKGIAESLGFADQSSFGKFFKKGTGMSPLNFRNKNQTSIE